MDNDTPASGLQRELGIRDLTLFGIIVITGPRWLPAAAHAGPGSVTLWLIAAVLMGAPLAVAVSALMAKYPGAGGLYIWTRNDFGPVHGFLAFWVYWVGIAFWFPSAALFYLSSSAYTFGPAHSALTDSRAFLLCGSLATIWIALGSNLIGLKTGKWTENFGAVAIALIGALLIIAASLRYIRQGSVTSLHFAPQMDWSSVAFWAAIAYGITGAEYFGMMGAEIRSPERTVKPAIWLATGFVAAFYAATTLAMLVLLKPESISEVQGLADEGQAIARFFAAPWVPPLIGCLLLVSAAGVFGGVGTALSRMPFVAGTDRLLPRAFGRIHPRWHTPHIALFTLGLVSSALLLLAQLGESMRAAYQEMVSMTFIGGFLPYVYLFLSSWKAQRKVAAVLGLAVTLLCLLCTIVPTADVTNVWLFTAKLGIGTVVMIGSGLLLYSRGRHSQRLGSGDPPAPRNETATTQ